MPAVSPLSTGLFDAHLERARAYLSAGQADAAEKELSEAYFLKPRDRAVLGLLGVLYFKQGRLERAEEVFSKLALEATEDSAVLFNLGLINFKLNRFREAEAAFLQALSFTKDRPRVHFYLGATYEKHGRVREAIHQFRLARTSHARDQPYRQFGPGTSDIPRPAPSPDNTAPAPRPDFASLPSATPDMAAPRAAPSEPEGRQPSSVVSVSASTRVGDDDNEDEDFFGEAKLIQVPGSDLQASRRGGDGPPLTLQPEVIRLGAEEEDLFLGGTTALPETKIALKQRDLVDIPFEGRVFFRRGTLVSSTGKVNFWVKEGAGESGDRLVIATGSGALILADAGRSIGLLAAEAGRKLWAKPGRVLAAEDALQPRYVGLPGAGRGQSVVEMEGAGFAAVSWDTLPHCVRVRLDEPLRANARDLIAWSGALTARLVTEPVPGRAESDGEVIELSGEGEALIESAED